MRGDRTIESVAASGALLGVGGRLRLLTAKLTLRPADVVVLYTDGLTDAGCSAPRPSNAGSTGLGTAAGGRGASR